MKRAFTARALAMLTWVLVLIAAPTGLYMSHVYNQLGEVRENNLRTLSKAAETTSQIIQTARQNVRNLRNNSAFMCEFLKRQPYLEWGLDVSSCSDAIGLLDEAARTLARAAKAAEADADTGEPVEVADIEITESEIRVARQDIDEVFQKGHLYAGTDGVQIVVRPVLDEVTRTNVQGAFDQNFFAFDMNMDVVLAAIPFGDALDLLFVADEAGGVVHQHRPASRRNAGLRVSSLQGLSTVGDDEPLKIEDLQRASSINRVEISSTEYQLLCQPLQVGLDVAPADPLAQNGGASASWLLCGLVASERLLRQSLAVAPFLAFTFFAVIVFGFLTWPGIKLLWMTKTDRLYFVDLCFLLFGTLGALMLATMLVLGVGSYLRLSDIEEQGLRELANDLESNLAGEVDDLALAMRSFDAALQAMVSPSGAASAAADDCLRRDAPWLRDVDNILSRPRANLSDPGEKCLRAQWKETLANVWRASLLRPPRTSEQKGTDGAAPEPLVRSDFQMVFWTDCNGKQLLKATPLGQNTPRVDIGHRRYFRAAIEDRLWQPNGADANGPARYVEPVRSVTTGKFTTIISTLSDVDVHKLGSVIDPPPKHAISNRCDGTVAVQAALISTSNTVLPPGVGFAIVDETGIAVLHSDERRALFENLYEEMEDGDRLESIIRSRSAQHMSTNYLGRPHRVFVKPLDTLPWTVVTFADTEFFSTANLEVLGHAALLASIYIALYIVLAILYFATRGPEIPMWFWPGAHGGSMSHWPLTIPAIALALLLFLMAIPVTRDYVLLPVVFVLPAVLFVALLSAYHWLPDSRKSEDSQDVRRHQVVSSTFASVIVWIAIAILPAGIFFANALNEQMAVLVHYENEYVAARTVDRNCAIDDYYRSVNRAVICDGDANCEFAERRSHQARDLYRSVAFRHSDAGSVYEIELTGPTSSSSGPVCDGPGENEQRGTMWSAFGAAKPIYNRTVLGSRYLSPGERNILAGNACWNWRPADAGRGDVFEFSAGPLPCNTSISLDSRRPLHNGYLSHPVVLGLGTVLIVMLFFWARYGARNIFFGDLRLPKEQLRDREQLEKRLAVKRNNDKVRLVAVAASQFDRSAMLRQSDDDEGAPRGRFNRYDMLDYMAGPAKRDELRQNLVRDLVAGTNILLVSPVDPYSLLDADETPEPPDPGDTAAIQLQQDNQRDVHRWRRILSRFRIVFVTVNLNPPKRAAKGIWQRELDRIVTVPWLDLELDALPELKMLRELLVEEVVGSTRRNALDRIVERAFGTYMALWDACTPKEKLVLVQIAFENVVNPKQVGIVRRLMQRGLLVRDPSLRIMNQSFARFIVQVQEPEEVRKWEQPDTGISWVHSRWALLGVLLLALLFLWATQRELFNSTITFLTAAAVGLPGMIKLLSSLNRLNVQGEK